jgi:hypothetical protein
MAEDLCACEQSRGLDSVCLDGDNPVEFPAADGADIHVIHGHIPDLMDVPAAKKVFVAHGTPETLFSGSVNTAVLGNGVSDGFMQSLYRVKTSDAVVTFWPRHQMIWQSMSDRGRTVDCIPMGIDKSKWRRVDTGGVKWAGIPSLLTAENCFECKWPLDLFIALPAVMKELRSMRLHCYHIPLDQVRWWTALAITNGAAYRSFMYSAALSPPVLLGAFSSVDFYIGLVRYGDHNRIGMEAHAAGCPVISYRGNEYADYWIDEGDQRGIAAQLLMILKGDVPKRETLETPDISETAAAMAKIYERIL